MEKILEQLLAGMQSIKTEMQGMKTEMQSMKTEMTTLATKDSIEKLEAGMNAQFEDLKSSITSSRIENINSDDHILGLLTEVKENVRYINRRVADTELDVHALKKTLKQ